MFGIDKCSCREIALGPRAYAHRKQELPADRDAWEAKLSGMSDAMLEHAAYIAPHVHGADRPGLETDDTSCEDGG